MKAAERYVLMFMVLAAAIVAVLFWRKSVAMSLENDQLRAQLKEMEDAATSNIRLNNAQSEELRRVRKQTQELMSLRNEVSQLRASSKTAQAAAAENERLKAEIKQLRAASAQATVPQLPGQDQSRDRFGREAWSFAGYSSPENALLSAVWAMKEGDPKTYFSSLSPEEQQRMADTWKDKSEQEIAAKHQQDVSAITGYRILTKDVTAPNEVVMSVYLEGTDQQHRIRVTQVGNDWKFAGFVPDQSGQGKPPAPVATP